MPVVARLSFAAIALSVLLILGTGGPRPAEATNPPHWEASIDMDPEDGEATAGTFAPVNVCTHSPDGSTPGSCVLGTREPCARVNENDVLDADEDVAADQLAFDFTASNIPGGVGAMMAFDALIQYPAPQVRIVAKGGSLPGSIGLLGTAPQYTGFSVSDSIPDTDGGYQVNEADLNGWGASGSGLLVRLTLETTAGAVPGPRALTVGYAEYGDLNSTFWPPASLNHAALVIGSGPTPDCSDSDADGYPAAVDNCPTIANPDQTDTDADGTGNACETDDDADGVYDTDESACGANPLLASSRPERIDGVFAGVSDDGDADIDEPLPAGSGANDCDGDGYLGSEENNVYQPSTQGDQDPCGTNSSPPTVPASPIGWPADLSPSGTANSVTLPDITSFIVPVRYFGTNVGTHAGDVRWDLKPGKGNGIYEINLNDITGLTTRRPAMLGGVRPFGGPPCPWPP